MALASPGVGNIEYEMLWPSECKHDFCFYIIDIKGNNSENTNVHLYFSFHNQRAPRRVQGKAFFTSSPHLLQNKQNNSSMKI